MPFLTRRLLAAAVAVALFSTLAPARAQSAPAAAAPGVAPADAEAGELDRVVVTGARVPRALSDLPISVSQVDEPAVVQQLSVSTNVLEGLDVLVPGLTTSQEEARTGCRTNIRGRQAQFLVNGVPTNDNLRRSNCGSLYSLSPFAVERIEVVRGSTAVYGAGAPGGAINLLTRRARGAAQEVDLAAQWSVNPHASSGSGETTVYAGTGRQGDAFGYYIGAGFQEYGVRRNPDGGILPGSTFDSASFNGSFDARLGRGVLRATALHHDEDPRRQYGTDGTQLAGVRLAGSATVVQPANPFFGQAATTQTLMTLAYEHPEVLGHALAASVYHHDERLIQRATDVFGGGVFYTNTDSENQRLGLRTSLNRAFALGEGALDATYGVDLLRQRYYRPQVNPATDAITGFIAPEVLLDSTAVFAQLQYRSGPWLFTGGARHEWFEGEVGDQGFAPSIPRASTPGRTPDFELTLANLGVVYDIAPALQVFAGFNQGAEISEFGRAARGVRDPSTINLDAATSDQVELGLRGRIGPVDMSAAAFRSYSDRAAALQADRSCVGQPLCPLIPLRLEQDIRGVELTADWRVSAALRVGGLFTWQDGEFNAPGATPVPYSTDTLVPMRTTAFVEFEPLPGWHNRLQATHHAATDIYDAQQEASGARETDDTFLVDFTTSHPLGAGTVYLGVANLLNERYVNATNQSSGDFFHYLAEGRRVTLGYRLGF
jgi:iron complex outermembrane receptor protein